MQDIFLSMDLNVLIDIYLMGISPRKLPEITKNIEFLATQSVEIYPGFIGKKIDYSKGYRTISISIVDGKSENLTEYSIVDRADVEGVVQHATIIGNKVYTLEEIDLLKKQSSERVHSDLDLK